LSFGDHLSHWYAHAQTALLLAKAKALALAGQKDLANRVFGRVDDDRWLHYNTASSRRFATFRDILPTLPDEQTQIGFIGTSGDEALVEAFGMYVQVKKLAGKHGRPIRRTSRILDFGCGWGRTLRFFMKDVPTANLTGIDVMPLAIELSKANNPWCNFELTTALPPTHFADESFDLIYLYSVFSHLSEEAHLLWLAEFQRIMKPGGVLIATTWSRDYIERCEHARNGETLGTHPRSLLAFTDTREALRGYDAGEFCHSAIGGGGELLGSFYGETCIPADYVRRKWVRFFEFREFISEPGEQSVIVARKR
jgi:2-polyprenyl-3-methyl-5-hydroxy-6-metoxy-1,4-benzoquinol methylase